MGLRARLIRKKVSFFPLVAGNNGINSAIAETLHFNFLDMFSLHIRNQKHPFQFSLTERLK